MNQDSRRGIFSVRFFDVSVEREKEVAPSEHKSKMPKINFWNLQVLGNHPFVPQQQNVSDSLMHSILAGRWNMGGSQMGKKDKNSVLDDYEELTNEIIRDKVSEIFRNHPKDYIAKLEGIGFEYFEDDVDDEELEERNAKPENQRQRDLVAYFENKKKLSKKLFESYSEEKAAENPNYPLIRKYFREANQNIKSLLLYGLDNYPGRIDLLSDLSFFHEFENILGILITYYTRACVDQGNLETFSELAKDFYYSTIPDGYDAYYALQELFEPDTDKRKIIDFLIAAEEETNDNYSQPIEI